MGLNLGGVRESVPTGPWTLACLEQVNLPVEMYLVAHEIFISGVEAQESGVLTPWSEGVKHG